MTAPATGTPLAILRHGPTPWSADRRLQGRADPPLSAAGCALVAGWRLPPDLAGARALTSPLARARQTAALLGLDAEVEPRLIEADWGAWEGLRLADLARDPVAGLARREADGLDFRPPGGESPREVQARLRPLLAALAADGRPAVAVAHKGVIRALYALATGWGMTGPPADRLANDACHRFRLAPDGWPSVLRLNEPLTDPAAPSPGKPASPGEPASPGQAAPHRRASGR
jgi:probable phosphoglycerate mutase